MNLIRYQAPEMAPWSPLDRWSNLRDELNSFFDTPSWSGFGRTGQLFTGWSPALDLYESGDHLVAVVELPGMRKEDIDISLHDGTLTISGERKRESTNGEAAQRTERYVGTFRRSIANATAECPDVALTALSCFTVGALAFTLAADRQRPIMQRNINFFLTHAGQLDDGDHIVA